MTTFQLIALAAAAVLLFVAGIAVHAWFTRQKSSILRIDAIKGAVDVLVAAANSTDDDALIVAATERKQSTALALQQALARLNTTAAVK
jgi:hypothetical protein